MPERRLQLAGGHWQASGQPRAGAWLAVPGLRFRRVAGRWLASAGSGPPISVGPGTYSVDFTTIVLTPDGKTAYVTGYAANEVTPISTATNTAGPPGQPIVVGYSPQAIALTP